MRHRRAGWSIALLAATVFVTASASAHAQDLITLGGTDGAKLLAQTSIPIRVHGQLVVAFNGDAATGCQLRGTCGYSGVVTWQPGTDGELEILRYREHGRIGYDAFLNVGINSGPVTAAHVERAIAGQPAGVCGDAQALGSPPDVSFRSGSFRLALLQTGGSMLSTRCAGPFDGDLAGISPRVTVSARALLAGRRSLDLSGTGTFASHGFAGTMTSTVGLRLGKPHTSRGTGGGSFPRGIKLRRFRFVSEKVTLTQLTGGLDLQIEGASDQDLCLSLDSCGAEGVLGLSPVARDSTGELTVGGPTKRPLRDFLAALGQDRRGRAKGLSVFGDVTWSDGGTVRAEIHQGTTCTDSASIGASDVRLTIRAGMISAGYNPLATLRTRCPGPFAVSNEAMALGHVPVGNVAARNFTIRLHGSRSFDDAGYTAAVHGQINLTFRRGRISQSTFLEPVG